MPTVRSERLKILGDNVSPTNVTLDSGLFSPKNPPGLVQKSLKHSEKLDSSFGLGEIGILEDPS